MAKEVTIWSSTARAKSMTPFHSRRVSTPLKPLGASISAGLSSFWNHVLFCQVPLTRRYDDPSASASFLRRGFARLMGGRYWKRFGLMPTCWLAPEDVGGFGAAGASDADLYGFQNRPPVTSTISTL